MTPRYKSARFVLSAFAIFLLLQLIYPIFHRSVQNFKGGILLKALRFYSWAGFDATNPAPPKPQVELEAIMRQSPTALLALLMDKVKRPDPVWYVRLSRQVAGLDFAPRWLLADRDPMEQCYCGFSVLGGLAEPAKPELLSLLKDRDLRRRRMALTCLMGMGSSASDVIPVLKAELSTSPPSMTNDYLLTIAAISNKTARSSIMETYSGKNSKQ